MSRIVERAVVGWREKVALPDWGVRGVLAKIDTGARTSALHVSRIEELPGDRVRFDVVLSRKDPTRTVAVEAELVRISQVKPSSGVKQRRHVVKTTLKLGAHTKTIEVSLVCRKQMVCRMLIGRTALGEDFLVDASQTFLLGDSAARRPRRKKAQ